MTLTHYAVFDDRDELIACWAAGYGETAVTVAALPPVTSRLDRLVLAEALTRLSHNLWHCYTHPASAMHSTAETPRAGDVNASERRSRSCRTRSAGRTFRTTTNPDRLLQPH